MGVIFRVYRDGETPPSFAGVLFVVLFFVCVDLFFADLDFDLML